MPEAPELRLPLIYRDTLTYLLNLSDSSYSDLFNLLSSLSPSLSNTEVIDRIAEILPSGVGSSSTRLHEFLISTRRLSESMDADVTLIAEALARAYSGRKTTSEQRIVLTSRLSQLLGLDFTKIRTKAIALRTSASLRMSSARCITDLRPVFTGDSRDEGLGELAGFLTVHTLRLDVRGSRDDSIYIQLERDDLEKLRDVVVRAIEKEERMATALLARGDVNFSTRPGK